MNLSIVSRTTKYLNNLIRHTYHVQSIKYQVQETLPNMFQFVTIGRCNVAFLYIKKSSAIHERLILHYSRFDYYLGNSPKSFAAISKFAPCLYRSSNLCNLRSTLPKQNIPANRDPQNKAPAIISFVPLIYPSKLPTIIIIANIPSMMLMNLTVLFLFSVSRKSKDFNCR